MHNHPISIRWTRAQHVASTFRSIKEYYQLNQHPSNYITAVQTLARAEPTYVDMKCFFCHTAGGDTAGAPKCAHTHGQTHHSITPLLRCIRPPRMCTTESARRRKNTSNSFSFFLSSAHFSHSWRCWNTSSSPSMSLLLRLDALYPAFLSLYPSLFPILFIRTGHAFLINHFHSFIYLFIVVSLFFSPHRFQALISCNLLAWHTNQSQREKGGEGESEIQDSNYQLLLECACVCLCMCVRVKGI